MSENDLPAIQQIPERIAYLILLYMHGLISPAQHNELDKWVEESDDNVELFATATDDDHIRFILNRVAF
jgi:transmembrane sensor